MVLTIGNCRRRPVPGGWVVECACGASSGRRLTVDRAREWGRWHAGQGCEGCDHVTTAPTWVNGRPARTGQDQKEAR